MGEYCFFKSEDGEIIRYPTAQVYVPIPADGSVKIRNSVIEFNFTEEVWAHLNKTVDEFVREHDLGERISLTTWIHCHPGGAFESSNDRRVQAQSGPWRGIVVGNSLLNNPPEAIDIESVRKATKEGQLHVITSNGLPCSIGLAPAIDMGEIYFDFNILRAYELPITTASGKEEKRPKSPGEVADKEILLEDGPQDDDVIVIEEDDLAKAGDQSQSAGLISVSLERGLSRGDEDVDIVIRQGDLDSINNVQIRITDIEVNQIDIVLAQIRKLLGF